MRLFPIVMALLLLADPSRADETPGPVADPTAIPAPDLQPTDQTPEGTPRHTGTSFTPLFAPIPFKNTQVGWGLVLMAGAIHRFDPDTTYKPSTGAVCGFYTENQSWGVMAVEVARFSRDRWRARGVLSHMDVNYDFYGIGEDAGSAGVAFGIEQKMDFAVLSGLRRVTHGVYAGAAAMWLGTTAKPKSELPPDVQPPSDDLSHANLVAPGLQAELDTRDDDYWPSHGSLAKLKGWFYASGLGSTREFQRYALFWSWYTRVSKPIVLATNANGLAVSGDVPFYALPALGTGLGGLRGYTQGRYRDRVAVTVQAEARYHTQGRLGAVMFGGFGQVAPEVSGLGKAEVLPAGGVGLRFQLTRSYPMHMRFDYAWGKDAPLFYFSVAEAF